MKNILRLILITVICSLSFSVNASEIFIFEENNGSDLFYLAGKSVNTTIYSDQGIDKGIQRAIRDLQSDLQKVTGSLPQLITSRPNGQAPLIIIGTYGTKSIVDDLVKQKKINKKN